GLRPGKADQLPESRGASGVQAYGLTFKRQFSPKVSTASRDSAGLLAGDIRPVPAETLPAVWRRGSQLLAHDATAVAHANQRSWGPERPAAERRVIRPGRDPL